MNMSRLTIFPVALLLTLFSCFHLSSSVYRVYIRQRDLHSYFEGTEHFDTIKGHHVDIIRHGQLQVPENGTLQLTLNSTDTDTGSGMVPVSMETMDNPLPAIPNDVDTVTISWHANQVVSYFLDIESEPGDHFETIGINSSMSGLIPQERAGFELKFVCHRESMGLGQLIVNLTTLCNSTDERVTAIFHLDKNCEGTVTSSSAGGMMTMEPSVFDMTSSYSSQSTVSFHVGLTTTQARSSPTPSATINLLVPYSNTEELEASTMTFHPTPSSPLLSSSVTAAPPNSSSQRRTSAVVMTTPLEEDVFMPYSSSIAEFIISSSSVVLLTSTVQLTSLTPNVTQSISSSLLHQTSSQLLSPSLSSSPSTSLSSSLAPSPSLFPSLAPSPSPSPSPSSSDVLSYIETSMADVSSSTTVPVVTTSTTAPVIITTTLQQEPSTTVISLVPSLSTSEVAVPPSTSSATPSLSSPAPPATSSQLLAVPVSSSATVLSPSPPLSTSVTSSSIGLQSSSSSHIITPPPSLSSLSLQPSSASEDLLPMSSTQAPVRRSSVKYEMISSSSVVIVSPSVDSSAGGQLNETIPEIESKLGDLLFIAFAPVVAILLLSICILLCCICCCVIKRKSKKPSRVFSDDPLDLPVRYSREVNENELEESFSKAVGPPLTVWTPLSWGTVSTLPAGVQSIIKHYAVDRRSLSILSNVAREDYGAIVHGQWNDLFGGDKGVMMKMLTGFQKQYGHRDEIVHFIEQATLLRGRDHPNLQKVLKVSAEDNYIPLVVYPIVEYGNLHQFLMFCRSSPTESPLNGHFRKLLRSATILPVTNQYKVNFALQIVSAMHYLSDEGIVHPDLALRNCLLDTNYNVKVTDSALSQLFFPECYSNVKGTVRPVRWAAIETLHHGECTSLSNVWSYGVTVWEVMTLAEMPYSEVDNNRSVLSCLMMGQRLPQPTDCPNAMYDVMMNCWEQDPSHRPSFDQIKSIVFEVSGRYTPIPALDKEPSIPSIAVVSASGCGHDTPTSRIQRTSSVTSAPQYVPIADDRPVMDRKTSGLSLSSQKSRESLQPDKLSITFSVLSEDILGEGDGSSSESNGEEEEEGSQDMLEPELLDRFMPSLRREQPVTVGGDTLGRRPTDDSCRPVLPLASTLAGGESGGGDLEDTLKYTRLPNTAFSPGPFSTSTLTSRLSPCETQSCSSSQYGPSTARSDETPVPGISSPSPDLTSKTSTLGDETLSIASNPLLTSTYHSTPIAVAPPLPPPAAAAGGGLSLGDLSRTSTMDSNTTISSSTAYDHTCHPPDLVFTPHLNGAQHNRSEHTSKNSSSTLLSNGHPLPPESTSSKPNGDVIKNTPPLDNLMLSDNSTSALDAKDSAVNGVVLREGTGGRITSRDSQLSRTSFGLGLGDLSNDLMSAFDSWKS